MKLKKKGWLKDYVDSRASLLNEQTHEISRQSSYPDHSLYRLLQPTGLMYGQNTGTWDVQISAEWNEKEKMKILLAESFISSSLLFADKDIHNKSELSEVIDETITKIGGFYNNVFPEISIPTKTLFGKSRSSFDVAELILEKRIERGARFDNNFWIGFFHNSLLFLDVFFFGKWIHTKSDKIIADFLKSEKEELHIAIIKVIAAAAHSNQEIEEEEKKFFDFFLEGANIKGDKRKEAIAIFESGLSLEEINLHASTPWLIKKYLLELAILTIWSDKKVEDQEHGFLKNLCKYFGLNDDDLENSMIAIEGFVLGHWGELDFLKNQKDYDRVSEQFIQRLSRIIEKNRSLTVREIKKNQTLMTLLNKAKSQELSEDEQESVRDELLKILKAIPAFLINSLPNSFLNYTALLKILPNNLIAEVLKQN